MIRNLFDEDDSNERPPDTHTGRLFGSEPEVMSIFGDREPENMSESEGKDERPSERPAAVPYTPPTMGQAVRMTGLAWSAGISLFGSIVFMLVIGWFADLLLGSSPWGKVAGIVIGSVIGFIQFFRINSEIFRTPKDGR